PYWKLATFSVLLIGLGALASLLAPWPLKILIDSVLQDHPLSPVVAFLVGPLAHTRIGLMLFVVIAGVLATLLQNGLTGLDNYVTTKIDRSMILDFRSDLFRHAQRLSLAFHDQRHSGKLIYAINSQADAIARLVMTIPPLAQSVLTLVGMFWILFIMDWQVALLALTVVPFLYYSVRYYMKNLQHQLYQVRTMRSDSLAIIHEAI